MKPVPIADYLDHIGSAPGERVSPRRDASPFRPRSLQSLQSPEPRPLPAFDRAPKVVAAVKPQPEAQEQRPLLSRRSGAAEPATRETLIGQGRGNGASTRGGSCAGTRGRPRRR
jgi:hypothetical protein